MRRLQINTPDGMYIEGVSSTRNYFFFEIDNIIDLAIQKNTVVEREFVCYFDNEMIVKDYFKITHDLEDELINAMKKTNKDSVKYLNEVKTNINFSQQFKEYLIKFDEKLCFPNHTPFVFSLDIYKQKQLFNHIYNLVGEHIYLELNGIIRSIEALFSFLVNEGGMDKETLNNFINNENNFDKVCSYVPTKMKSVSDNRIDTVYPSLNVYKEMQDSLFKELPFYISFEECMNLQRTFVSDLYNEYHNKMFESIIVDSSEMLENEVIYPIVLEYKDNINQTLEQFS